MATNRAWVKSVEKRWLIDTKEVLGFLLISFEKASKPRMQYKRVRTALQIAIESVEKQTPKKVAKNSCPECGRLVALRYCERCGQRLEW